MVSSDLNFCEHFYAVKMCNYPKYLKDRLSYELDLIYILFLLMTDL